MNTLKLMVEQIKRKNEVLNKKFIPDLPIEDSKNEVFELNKDANKDFIILNITDIHYSDYDIRYPMSFGAEHTIKELVKNVNPDLITVTGDIICGKSGYFGLKRFIEMMESFDVPWAPVFGNHDDETNCDIMYIAQQFIKAPNCLFHLGNPDFRAGNYAVVIKSENTCIESLIMTDSIHGQMSKEHSDWAVKLGNDINSKETSIFMHIPIPEYQAAYDRAYDEKNKNWISSFEAFGEQHETICCSRDADGNPVYTGLLDNLKHIDSLKHIICGHEHLNNWSILYDGVRLTYTLKVGQGSGYRPQFNGGTVIAVDNNGIKSIAHRTRRNGKFINIEYKEMH